MVNIMAKKTIDELVQTSDFLSLTKNEDRIDYLCDAGIKAKEAKEWVKANGSSQREIDYPTLVKIFKRHTVKKEAIAELVAKDVCSAKTGEHLWAAIKFAKEWANQSK